MLRSFPEHQDGPYRVRQLGRYLEAHQGRCFGKPTFRGTRVLVHLALESLAEEGQTIESVAADYGVEPEALREAVHIAATLIRENLRLPKPAIPQAADETVSPQIMEPALAEAI